MGRDLGSGKLWSSCDSKLMKKKISHQPVDIVAVVRGFQRGTYWV
jgi:hypothetical protein